MVKFNKPGLVFWNATEHTVQLIDITVPQDYNMAIAIANKITKYDKICPYHVRRKDMKDTVGRYIF